MNRTFFILIFLTFFGKNIYAQDTAYKRINKFLSTMNMQFFLPKDYVAQKSNFYFGCDAFLSAPIHYTILKKNKNILIGIYFGKSPEPIELSRIRSEQKMFHEKSTFESDSNYIYGAKAKADTIHHTILYLPQAFVRMNNNGDRGVVYIRNCKTPMYLVDDHGNVRAVTDYEFKKHKPGKILKTYNHNKIVSISKDGRGHIELAYLYTDNVSEKEINKEIITTSKMLQFNN